MLHQAEMPPPGRHSDPRAREAYYQARERRRRSDASPGVSRRLAAGSAKSAGGLFRLVVAAVPCLFFGVLGFTINLLVGTCVMGSSYPMSAAIIVFLAFIGFFVGFRMAFRGLVRPIDDRLRALQDEVDHRIIGRPPAEPTAGLLSVPRDDDQGKLAITPDSAGRVALDEAS
jgi:hypothetical protein